MHIEKFSTKKVSERVVEEIEKMIESGLVKAGEKLPSVRELCEMFNVGRSAVRDAITTLKGKGVVQVKQGEGAYICSFNSTNLFNYQLLLPPNTRDISELFQVRKILEPGIAEIAAANRQPKDVLLLEKALTNGSPNRWEADYDFHMAIANLSGNQMFIQLLKFISTTTKKAMNNFHQHIQGKEEIVMAIEEQHQQIYEAIKLGDPAVARQKMSEHLMFVEELLLTSVLSAK